MVDINLFYANKKNYYGYLFNWHINNKKIKLYNGEVIKMLTFMHV